MNKEQFQIPEEELRERAKQDGVTKLVVGVAVTKDERLLIIRRVQEDFLGGYYELPGGGVDKGESLKQSIIRETLEETGLQVAAILSMHEGFDYITDSDTVRQFNFLVEVLNGEVILEPTEHDDFQWISENELDTYPMTPNMRKSIAQLLEDLHE